jgi:ribonuclease HII
MSSRPLPPQASLALAAPAPLRAGGRLDAELRASGVRWLIGVDEVGRGPLCGPVVAAAVCLPAAAALPGLDDSKRLSEARREALAPAITAAAQAAAVAFVGVEAIAAHNILGAALMAMRQAVEEVWAALQAQGAGAAEALVLVDGNRPLAGLRLAQRTLVGGDGRSAAIAAASVLAKVARDRHMIALDARLPGYDLARNKGYPSPAHLRALAALGPTPEHRRDFGPVRAALAAHRGAR